MYASGSGTIQNLSKLAGSTVKQGEVLCTVSSETVRDQLQNARLNLQNAELAASMAADVWMTTTSPLRSPAGS